MPYSFSDLLLNQRNVPINDIIESKAIARTAFEEDTFFFIKNWLQEKHEFTLTTSGSTGKPKTITLTRNQLQKSAQRTITAFGLTSNDTSLVCLDTKYIAGKMMLARALEGNMKIIAVEPSGDPLRNVHEPISFTALVPLQLQEILKHSTCVKKLNQLKAVIVGGGAVNYSLLSEIQQKITCPVYATYGMTETVSHIALQRLNGNEASDNFITLPDVDIEIDERGCLVIQLPGFQDKIITNDLAELVTSTSFRWLGRFDNVINSGGFKISPEKIEKIVESIFQERMIDRPFFICSLPDNRLGQKLILIIEGFPVSGQNKILSALQAHLHPYEVPKQIFNIREFTRTETGKINRLKTIALIG